MDSLNGICVAGRAAGNAGDPAPEKRQKRWSWVPRNTADVMSTSPVRVTLTPVLSTGCCSLSCWHGCPCYTWKLGIAAAIWATSMDSPLSLLLCANSSTFKFPSGFSCLASPSSAAMLQLPERVGKWVPFQLVQWVVDSFFFKYEAFSKGRKRV